MDHTVGYVLLGSAAVPAFIGWSLAKRGLDAAETTAQSAKDVADAAAKQVANAQIVTAAATGAEAVAVADATREATVQMNDLQNQVGSVNEALKELTGKLAPARVAFALATLLAVSALFALGVMSASAGSDSGGSTTTVTTTPTTTTATTP